MKKNKTLLQEVARFQAIAGIKAVGSLGNAYNLNEESDMEEGILSTIGGAIKKGAEKVDVALGGSPKDCIQKANAADPASVKSGVKSSAWFEALNGCRREHGLTPLGSHTPGRAFGVAEGEDEMEEGLGDFAKKVGGAIKKGAERAGHVMGGSPKDCIERGDKIVALAKSKGIDDAGNLDKLKWMEINNCRREHKLSPLATHVPGRAFGATSEGVEEEGE